ncbi:geranylgeranyl reductase, putative [Babesia ovis]|uniref:Geranylgeranyl reductase, putative n=1 Tax=Babesia ovis TaxID=5869 RepID=A0A9W5TAY9_BABOV|nr:geranylgeranyl reductase, putative [Babesia ovis]
MAGLFVVSFFRLRRSSYPVITYNGEHMTLTTCRSGLLAHLALFHANALSEDLLMSTLAWLYSTGVQQVGASQRSRIHHLGDAICTIGDWRLPVSSTSARTSSLSKASSASKVDQKLRPRKTVTFNEHVEVRLIDRTRFGDYQPGYFANRYNLVNHFTLIPANTFVQRH